MKKIFTFLEQHTEEVISVILMALATSIIVIQVFMRYVMRNSLSWSEEVARYLFVWLTFISISFGIKERKHVKIEAALLLFPARKRPVITIIGDIFTLVWSVFVMVVGWNLLSLVVKSGQVSPALSVPMWCIYIAPCIGYTLSIFRSLQTILLRIKNYRNGVEMND